MIGTEHTVQEVTPWDHNGRVIASPDDPLAGDAPTVSVPAAARALGVARNSLYAAIAAGTAPVQVVRVNRSIRVSTASLRRALGLEV